MGVRLKCGSRADVFLFFLLTSELVYTCCIQSFICSVLRSDAVTKTGSHWASLNGESYDLKDVGSGDSLSPIK